ncbi:TetR/AcrR family transcriptional regulator [Cryobacterium melibiosiphilum]|nr:TetR/AcrR family transcriptional regulator [Cryobacterium melibiosiphilum]
MSAHRQGPVRSEAARVAILQATARLFAARGYDHLTMEGIAGEAGVGKQTIYRWWPSKGAVVADCLLDGLLFPEQFALPNTGELREDLATWLRNIFGVLEHPSGEMLMRSLIAAAAENADVGLRLYDSLGTGSTLNARLHEAVSRAELEGDTPVEQVGDALVGAVVMRALSRLPTPAGLPEQLVDAVLGRSATLRP